MKIGYYCGLRIDKNGLCNITALRCGDFVESQYFMPISGKKGGRFETQDVAQFVFQTLILRGMRIIYYEGLQRKEYFGSLSMVV